MTTTLDSDRLDAVLGRFVAARDALVSQAGEQATRQVVTEAGFTRFCRAAQTPFNLVYEVRP